MEENKYGYKIPFRENLKELTKCAIQPLNIAYLIVEENKFTDVYVRWLYKQNIHTQLVVTGVFDRYSNLTMCRNKKRVVKLYEARQ